MAEIKAASDCIKSEAPVIAFLNIMFAVFQLVMVSYSLGQSTAVIAVNSTLADAAVADESNGVKFIFTGPFFVNDGDYYASGYASAVYLVLGSLLHLGIGLLLLHGARKQSGTLCLIWFFFTSVFLIGHVVATAVRTVGDSSNDLLTSHWNGPQILTEVAFGLLIALEGLQVWVVYEFATVLPNSRWDTHEVTLSEHGTPAINHSVNICKNSGGEFQQQEKPPKYSDAETTGKYPENTKIQFQNILL